MDVQFDSIAINTLCTLTQGSKRTIHVQTVEVAREQAYLTSMAVRHWPLSQLKTQASYDSSQMGWVCAVVECQWEWIMHPFKLSGNGQDQIPLVWGKCNPC